MLPSSCVVSFLFSHQYVREVALCCKSGGASSLKICILSWTRWWSLGQRWPSFVWRHDCQPFIISGGSLPCATHVSRKACAVVWLCLMVGLNFNRLLIDHYRRRLCRPNKQWIPEVTKLALYIATDWGRLAHVTHSKQLWDILFYNHFNCWNRFQNYLLS